MRLLIWLMACIGLLHSNPVLADGPSQLTNEELRARAEERFRVGVELQAQVGKAREQFGRAADDFLELYRQGARTAEVCGNLGRAAFLADDLPRAIWAFRQGLALDPNHRDLREHLEFARTRINGSSPGRSLSNAWPPWLPRPTIGLCLIVGGVGYSAAWLFAAGWYVRRTSRWAFLTSGAAVLALAGITGCVLDMQQRELERLQPLIVIAEENSSLHRGNGASYPLHPDVPTLPSGREARQLHRRGAWVCIQLAGGEIAWVHGDQVLTAE
jgi:hypothetical protein